MKSEEKELIDILKKLYEDTDGKYEIINFDEWVKWIKPYFTLKPSHD